MARKPLSEIPEYNAYLRRLEGDYSLPSGVLSSVLKQESSGGDPRQFLSPKGARGPFQFMPATAKEYGINPNDPMQAARGAARYLKNSLDQYGGDLPKALASYHGGPDQSQWGPKTRSYTQKVLDFILPTASAQQPEAVPEEDLLAEARRRGIKVGPKATTLLEEEEDLLAEARRRGIIVPPVSAEQDAKVGPHPDLPLEAGRYDQLWQVYQAVAEGTLSKDKGLAIAQFKFGQAPATLGQRIFAATETAARAAGQPIKPGEFPAGPIFDLLAAPGRVVGEAVEEITPEITGGAAGLLAQIALDPTSYVPLGPARRAISAPSVTPGLKRRAVPPLGSVVTPPPGVPKDIPLVEPPVVVKPAPLPKAVPVPPAVKDVTDQDTVAEILNTAGGKFVRIHQIRESLGWPRKRFDDAINRLRDEERISLHGGDPSTMTDAELRGGYSELWNEKAKSWKPTEPFTGTSRGRIDHLTVSESAGAMARQVRAVPEDILVTPGAFDIPEVIPGLRLSKLLTTDDVKGALISIERLHPEISEARGGTITWAETNREAQALATSLGSDLSKMKRWYPEPGQATAKLRAGGRLLVSSAEDVHGLARRVAGGESNAIAEFSQSLARHAMIQQEFAKGRAEAGRQLQILRQTLDPLEGFAQQTGLAGTIEEATTLANRLVDIAESGGSVQLSKAIGKVGKPGWGDWLLEFWYSNILSGPQTHVVNTVGGASVQGLGLVERGVAGKLFGIDMGTRAHVAGLFKSVPEALRAAKESFRTEITQLPTKLEVPRPGAIPGKLGRVIRIPGRALAAEDAFFQTMGYRGALNRLAYQEGIKKGLRGETLSRFVDDLARDPTDAMKTLAGAEARMVTFTGKPGAFAKALQTASNVEVAGLKPIKFIMPFIRTPANIVTFAAQRTPAAFFFKEVRDAIAQGGEARALAYSRVLIGTSLMGSTGLMSNAGIITGGPPRDPGRRAMWYAAGNQPYSVDIAGVKVSYNRVEPFGQLMGWSADAANFPESRSSTEWGLAILAGFTQSLMDKTYLSGPGDFFNLMADPERYVQRYLTKLGQSFVPASSFLRQLERSTDPTLREGFFAGIPFLSEVGQPRLGVFGEPIVLPGGPADIVNPMRMTQQAGTPEGRVLLEADITATRAPKTLTHKGVEVELSEDQQWEFEALRGRLLKETTQVIIRRTDWKSLDPETRKHLLELGRLRANQRSVEAMKRTYGRELWGR